MFETAAYILYRNITKKAEKILQTNTINHGLQEFFKVVNYNLLKGSPK